MAIAEKANVGTSGAPVSWLHQRAVALLYDEITNGLRAGTQTTKAGEVWNYEVRVLKEPCGELTDNLLADVTKVKVPGEWDQVGGVVPDLILYGEEDQPVRIIEVVVTNPPNSTKQKKLATLRRRGVDVVLVTIRNESDLLKLCWTPVGRSQWSGLGFNPLYHNDTYTPEYGTKGFTSGAASEGDRYISKLSGYLRRCSPAVRREFVATLCSINKLDSLFPLRPDNPLKEQLSQGEL